MLQAAQVSFCAVVWRSVALLAVLGFAAVLDQPKADAFPVQVMQSGTCLTVCLPGLQGFPAMLEVGMVCPALDGLRGAGAMHSTRLAAPRRRIATLVARRTYRGGAGFLEVGEGHGLGGIGFL